MIQNKFRMLRTYFRNSEKNKIEIQSGCRKKVCQKYIIILNVTGLPHIIKKWNRKEKIGYTEFNLKVDN